MSTLQTIRRITVYTASSYEEDLLDSFLKLGAKGFTVIPCRGKGEHRTLDDVFAASTQVRIEILAQPALAAQIMHYLEVQEAEHLPITSCVEDVSVYDATQF